MIVQAHFMVDGRDFVRTTSNACLYVVRDGVSYTEACDPAEYGRTYTEGEIMDDADLTAQAEEIINILMGGDGV